MQHNTWTRTKPTITESCLLVVKSYTLGMPKYEMYEVILDGEDVILYQRGKEDTWQYLTAQQYLTLKLPI